jgi:glucose-6-phosphate isomerase
MRTTHFTYHATGVVLTLEPGIAFCLLRAAMMQKYGEAYRDRIIATGSRGPGQLGEFFYFLMFVAYLSGSLLGLDSFTQDGVEGYKKNMYRLLGKDRA